MASRRHRRRCVADLVLVNRLLHISHDLLLQRLPDGLVRTLNILEVLQVLVQSFQACFGLFQSLGVALADLSSRDSLLLYNSTTFKNASVREVVVDALLDFDLDGLFTIRTRLEPPATCVERQRRDTAAALSRDA